MNVVNRILIILLALLMLVAGGAVLLVALDVVEPAQLAPTAWFQDRLDPFTGLESATQAWTVGVCIALLLLGLVLLFFELKPSDKERWMTLKEDGLGRITVARDAIAALVNREAMQVPGVMEGRAKVEEDKGRLRIWERVSVDPAAQLPELTQAVQKRIKETVEYHLGRPVADVRVDAQLEPLEHSGRRVR